MSLWLLLILSLLCFLSLSTRIRVHAFTINSRVRRLHKEWRQALHGYFEPERLMDQHYDDVTKEPSTTEQTPSRRSDRLVNKRAMPRPGTTSMGHFVRSTTHRYGFGKSASSPSYRVRTALFASSRQYQEPQQNGSSKQDDGDDYSGPLDPEYENVELNDGETISSPNDLTKVLTNLLNNSNGRGTSSTNDNDDISPNMVTQQQSPVSNESVEESGSVFDANRNSKGASSRPSENTYSSSASSSIPSMSKMLNDLQEADPLSIPDLEALVQRREASGEVGYWKNAAYQSAYHTENDDDDDFQPPTDDQTADPSDILMNSQFMAQVDDDDGDLVLSSGKRRFRSSSKKKKEKKSADDMWNMLDDDDDDDEGADLEGIDFSTDPIADSMKMMRSEDGSDFDDDELALETMLLEQSQKQQEKLRQKRRAMSESQNMNSNSSSNTVANDKDFQEVMAEEERFRQESEAMFASIENSDEDLTFVTKREDELPPWEEEDLQRQKELDAELDDYMDSFQFDDDQGDMIKKDPIQPTDRVETEAPKTMGSQQQEADAISTASKGAVPTCRRCQCRLRPDELLMDADGKKLLLQSLCKLCYGEIVSSNSHVPTSNDYDSYGNRRPEVGGQSRIRTSKNFKSTKTGAFNRNSNVTRGNRAQTKTRGQPRAAIADGFPDNNNNNNSNRIKEGNMNGRQFKEQSKQSRKQPDASTTYRKPPKSPPPPVSERGGSFNKDNNDEDEDIIERLRFEIRELRTHCDSIERENSRLRNMMETLNERYDDDEEEEDEDNFSLNNNGDAEELYYSPKPTEKEAVVELVTDDNNFDNEEESDELENNSEVLDGGWVRMVDPDTGEDFFMNHDTQELKLELD